MATNLDTARSMIEIAYQAGIQLGVVSQHRFDDSTQFLHRALCDGRLGKILQADAYVKWYRSPAYYSRPIKGSWKTEGGGALIIQAIHQVDVLLWLMGGVQELFGYWQLAARHNIESEDVLAAVLKYASGATGVIQASTAFWPGHTERIEIHGTKGTAIITGDKLTAWQVENDFGRTRAGVLRLRHRRHRPDGYRAHALRAPVHRFRRSHSHRTQAPIFRRRRVPGVASGDGHLRFLPKGIRGEAVAPVANAGSCSSFQRQSRSRFR